ncbi:MAG: iron-containing alcohol dehydrogenase [Clostridia bacterium]|nr:iron-containing alcohol dehydrogenase [Clostridia bacterium]
MNFDYYMPTKLVFGCGKVSLVGTYTAGFGKKAMIVTGRNSTKKTGLLDRVKKYLEEEKIEYHVFDQIEENPLTTIVAEGADYARRHGCEVVIGLGGGSAIDAAKGIAFLAVNDGDISDYIFGKPGHGALSIIAITTTAGTGSEGDSLAVLTNPETKDKKALKSPYVYPKVSIIDPELMTTLPQNLIAATGLDALCHAIEAYINKRSNPVSDVLALKAIEIISENLPKVYADPDDIEAWSHMALANTLGGMVIDSAGVTLGHGLEHSVSGLLNVRHGEGLAAILVVMMEYSYQASPVKFANIAKAMGVDTSNLSVEAAAANSIHAVKKLLDKLDLKFTLGSLGVKEEHIEWLAENCIKTMTYAISNNPKVPDVEEIKKLYRKCL